MLATQKDLCCLIQPTSILSRNSGINKWLTCVCTNSDSSIVDCRPIDNSNQRYNQRPSEFNSLVRQRSNRDSSDRLQRIARQRHRSIPDQINQAVRTAVNCLVHQINTIVFGCYPKPTKFAPAGKAKNQKFVQMPQSAKSLTFTAERGSICALTTPLSIKFFAVFSQKFDLEASPFMSCGGVSKHQ